jgi:hypothetical protein
VDLVKTTDANDRYKEAVAGAMEEKAGLNAALIIERTRDVKVKRMQGELLLAKAREEVIVKDLVEKQAAYLLVALRQRLLSMASANSRKILGITDVKQANRILREIALGILNEIKDLPQKVVDPKWLEDLDAEDKEK